MKVSLNWIKQYLDFELPPVDELVEKIGAQLGAVESVENLGEKYRGVLIVKVVECHKHEDSDHLNVCLVDDGGKVQGVERNEQGLVQIITGATNVHAGMLAAWLPPGSTVPETVDKEPFVLEARELRGMKSNGMLASQRELALGDNHEGIMGLDDQGKPGGDFAETYRLNDYTIDIENKMFTHRPDCFGALGVAREIAGILGHKFTSPEWYQLDTKTPEASGEMLPLEVRNELPELVPRFMALLMSGVEIKPSPVWLQVALSKIGQKPISNIVDLTNFYMLLTGQPLHAYDYDKVKQLSGADGAAIVVRYPKPGERLTLLNGKEVEPRPEAIMIATDQKLIGLGGVMGGADTEVDEHTKNIILECATFDMYSVRRTSMAHGLFTDAVTRFNKGQSPLQNSAVLAKIAGDIQKIAHGKVAGEPVDDNHVQGRGWIHPPVPVSADFINARLGLKLSADEMKRLLENVEFKVDLQGPVLQITAPFWRTDIETREDVVEEVGRLYGFDKLPLELPQRSVMPAAKDLLLTLKQQIHENLMKSGANEVLTYSFVHGNLMDKAGQDKTHAFQIANALSPDLQYYRLSLVPSLLEKVHPNIKAGYDEFALFELGKAHIADQNSDDGLPREDELTALVIAAADKLKKPDAAYYAARKYLVNLLKTKLTFKPVSEEMRGFDITKPYDINRAAFIYSGETFLGIIGEFRSSVKQAFKLPEYCAGFELDTAALLKIINQGKSYTPLSKFPKVAQDITLKVTAGLPYQELFSFMQENVEKAKAANTTSSLMPLDIFQREEDKSHKQITFRLQIASYEKTLTDSEVTQLLDQVAAAAKEKFGAERV